VDYLQRRHLVKHWRHGYGPDQFIVVPVSCQRAQRRRHGRGLGVVVGGNSRRADYYDNFHYNDCRPDNNDDYDCRSDYDNYYIYFDKYHNVDRRFLEYSSTEHDYEYSSTDDNNYNTSLWRTGCSTSHPHPCAATLRPLRHSANDSTATTPDQVQPLAAPRRHRYLRWLRGHGAAENDQRAEH